MSIIDRQDAVVFDVLVSLEDQVALQMRCLATPAMRVGRLRREAITVAIAALCAPLAMVLGTLFAWVDDRRAITPSGLLRATFVDEPRLIGGAVLVTVACAVGGAVMQRALVRSRLRRVLRKVLHARPDVDATDPRLPYQSRVVVDGRGLEGQSAAGATLVRWEILKRWEEADERILVLGDAMSGFCLPTTDIDTATLTTVRAILESRFGPAASAAKACSA